jgi:excisionase family DNA binding protein
MNNITITVDPQILESFRTIVREELNRKAEEIKKNPKSHTRQETCRILGCSLPTLDKYIDMGLLNSVKVGRRIYIPESSIEEFLSRRK